MIQDYNGYAAIEVSSGKAYLRFRLKSIDAILGEVPVKGREAVVRVESKDGGRYEFFADGKPLGSFETSLLSSEVVGGFTGVMLGLFAEGGQASFEYFDYQEK